MTSVRRTAGGLRAQTRDVMRNKGLAVRWVVPNPWVVSTDAGGMALYVGEALLAYFKEQMAAGRNPETGAAKPRPKGQKWERFGVEHETLSRVYGVNTGRFMSTMRRTKVDDPKAKSGGVMGSGGFSRGGRNAGFAKFSSGAGGGRKRYRMRFYFPWGDELGTQKKGGRTRSAWGPRLWEAMARKAGAQSLGMGGTRVSKVIESALAAWARDARNGLVRYGDTESAAKGR